jgi:3-hydroxyisobutyryl-CoA hydrolase
MGGASPFSVACKYSVATGRTIYAMPETAIGFFNDAGASYFLSRLPMNIGLYIGLTGARVKGYDMKNAGLATHFVESSKLPHLEKDLINCKNDESIVQILNDYDSKEEVNDSMSISMNIERIDKTFDGQTVEEIYDNLHLEGSDFSMATIRILNSMSPTSLKVTHQSIMNGKHLSLHDCLRTEYRLAYNFNTKECDFKEGTRAVLIDKDNKPKWHPSNIKDVKNIEKFFEPLPNQEELTF